MDLHTWFVYVATVFVVTVTPGPSVLLCVTSGIKHGARNAAFSAAGIITALVCLMSLSAVGLGTLLATSELAFRVVKWLGAAYLMYLGMRMLLSKGSSGFAIDAKASERASTVSPRKLYIEGLIVGLSNPKALVFFGALFPQFLNSQAPQLTQFAVLCATFVAFEAFWLMTYASFAARLAPWLQQPGRQLIFDRACGSTFMGAGLLLLLTKRSAST